MGNVDVLNKRIDVLKTWLFFAHHQSPSQQKRGRNIGNSVNVSSPTVEKGRQEKRNDRDTRVILYNNVQPVRFNIVLNIIVICVAYLCTNRRGRKVKTFSYANNAVAEYIVCNNNNLQYNNEDARNYGLKIISYVSRARTIFYNNDNCPALSRTLHKRRTRPVGRFLGVPTTIENGGGGGNLNEQSRLAVNTTRFAMTSAGHLRIGFSTSIRAQLGAGTNAQCSIFRSISRPLSITRTDTFQSRPCFSFYEKFPTTGYVQGHCLENLSLVIKCVRFFFINNNDHARPYR